MVVQNNPYKVFIIQPVISFDVWLLRDRNYNSIIQLQFNYNDKDINYNYLQ